MDSIRPVRAVGYSARAWVPVLGVLLAMAMVAGGCAADEGVTPAEEGPSPAAPTSSVVTTTTVSVPEPSSTTVPPSTATTGNDSLPEPPPTSLVDTTTTVSVPEPSSTTAPSSVVAATTLPPPEPSKEWTLLAGGDVLMDRTEPAGVDPFVFIEPAFASADLAVVNSEMAISDRGVRANKRFAFRAPPSAAGRIASAGIDVASLGNNHARDYGPVALVDTVDLLEAAGVVAVGAGATDVEAYRYRVLRTAGDVSVAFVGASMTVPRGFAAGPDSAGIASVPPASRVVESVRAAAGAADVVIAVVHWGIELATCPSGTQRDFARELVDAGADAVIGHGPHVVQPVDFSDGKLVAYSLGHLVWHPRWGITRDTGVLQIDFDADEIVGWAFHPHLLNEDGAPVPVAEGRRYDRIVDIIAGNCRQHQPPPSSTTTTPTTTTPTEGPTDTSTSTSSTTSTTADASTTTLGATDTTTADA